MQLEVGQQVERYVIEALIGEGGQGRVYQVRHDRLGTEHALKVVLNASAGVRDRLLREGRAQAHLVHENIVRVTDVIDVGGQPGLVMEFIRGPSLDELIGQQSLSIAQVDELARGILAGMQHAHSRRFVHRDLKPMNILCAVTARGPVPKIADFGLVKALGAEGEGLRQTRTGVMMGSAHYMSPEQIRSTRSVDERSDLWAMAVILYEMLTGSLPFTGGDDLFEIFASITRGQYTPARELRPEIPERMERAIAAALKIDPDDRIGDADTLLALWRGDIESAQDIKETGVTNWDMSSLSQYGASDGAFKSVTSDQTWADGTLAENSGLPDKLAAPPAPSQPGSQELPVPATSADTGSFTPSRKLAAVTIIGMALVSGLIGVAGLAWLWSSQQDAPQSVAQGTTAPVPVQAPAVASEPTPTEAPEPVREQANADELDEANPDEPPNTEVEAVAPEPAAVASLPATRPVVSKKPDPVRTVTNPEPVPQEPTNAEPTLGTLVVNRAGLTAADQFFLANARGQIIKDGDPVPGGTWKIQYRRDNGVQLLDSPIIKLADGQGVSLTCSAVPRCRHSVK